MRIGKLLHDCVTCIAVGGWMLALAACTPQQSSPSPYFSATDISLDSPTDGWAVGEWVIPKGPARGQPSDASLAAPLYATITPAMAHLQHGQWRLAPKSVTGDLGTNQSYRLVRMLSPTDGWAVVHGLYGDTLYHFDGAHWSLVFPLVNSKIQSITITDLQMLSPNVGWAVGPTGILQYTLGVWKNVTDSLPPRPADWSANWNYPGLRSVAIVSPTDAWAMGDGGMIWRYGGAHWRIVTSPYFPNRYYTSTSVNGFTANDALLAHFAREAHNQEALYATQMLSPTDGWSVGGATLAPLSINWGPAVVERYQAGSWQIAHVAILTHTVNEPYPYREPVFYSLAMTSTQDGWIGGAWVTPTQIGAGDAGPAPGTPVYASLLLQYHMGQWSFVSVPDTGAIHRLAMVDPEEGWAAADGGLLHYAGGQWQLVQVSLASV